MFHHVTARVFVRSTEDEQKVRTALDNVIPGAGKKAKKYEHRGVYGNKFFSLIFSGGKKEAKTAWKHIWDRLEEGSKLLLKAKIHEFVDEFGNLHLRFRKQEAYRGILDLGKEDVIKVMFKLEAYPATYENFLEKARRLVK